MDDDESDGIDARLNASSPFVSMGASVDLERSALAYATERMARSRRRSRLPRFGIPALVALLALGGASAAFATPAIQHSLGLAPRPSATATPTATPPAARVVPFPGCHLSFTVVNGSTTAPNVVGLASMNAAREYFANLDESKLLGSPAFWDAFGEPAATEIPPGADAATVALVQQMRAEMNSARERFALGEVAADGLSKYLLSQNLSPSAVGTTATALGCGEDQ